MPKKSVRKSKRKVCRKKLSEKVAININEYKQGRYVSIPQAIAVSYSQVSKKYPSCKPFLQRKSQRKKSQRKSRTK
jgi:hypothetical protein